MDWEFSAFASGYDDCEQQFAYFTSVEAVKKANPAEFEGAGNMTKLAGYTTPIYNVVKGAMSGTQLLGDAIIAFVKDYGKDWIAGNGINFIKLLSELIKGKRGMHQWLMMCFLYKLHLDGVGNGLLG